MQERMEQLELEAEQANNMVQRQAMELNEAKSAYQKVKDDADGVWGLVELVFESERSRRGQAVPDKLQHVGGLYNLLTVGATKLSLLPLGLRQFNETTSIGRGGLS